MIALLNVQELNFMQPIVETITSHSGCNCVPAFQRRRQLIPDRLALLELAFPSTTLAAGLQEIQAGLRTANLCPNQQRCRGIIINHENVYLFHDTPEMFVFQMERMHTHPTTGLLVKNTDPIRFGPDATITLESGQRATYTVISGKICLNVY